MQLFDVLSMGHISDFHFEPPNLHSFQFFKFKNPFISPKKKVRNVQVRIGQVETCQVKAGQVKAEQVKSGQGAGLLGHVCLALQAANLT